jgi:hypothetical protein
MSRRAMSRKIAVPSNTSATSTHRRYVRPARASTTTTELRTNPRRSTRSVPARSRPQRIMLRFGPSSRTTNRRVARPCKLRPWNASVTRLELSSLGRPDHDRRGSHLPREKPARPARAASQQGIDARLFRLSPFPHGSKEIIETLAFAREELPNTRLGHSTDRPSSGKGPGLYDRSKTRRRSEKATSDELARYRRGPRIHGRALGARSRPPVAVQVDES